MIRRFINDMQPFERVGVALKLAILVYVLAERFLP
ncbi:hypothetical protein J2X50_003505 [Aminobacter sp. BE322]